MALTEEQIKNLKPGDPVIVEATFCKLDCEGDVVSVTKCTSRGKRVNGAFFAATSCVSLPPEKPKYDPCRLFKEGDKVRIVDWNGRKLNRVDMPDLLEVEIDEHLGDNEVSVFWKGSKHWGKCNVQQCYLELVTPVEENENNN